MVEEIHNLHNRRFVEGEDCYSHMELLAARDCYTSAERHNPEEERHILGAEEVRNLEEDRAVVSATEEDMDLVNSLEAGMVVESGMEGIRNRLQCAVGRRTRSVRGSRTFQTAVSRSSRRGRYIRVNSGMSSKVEEQLASRVWSGLKSFGF